MRDTSSPSVPNSRSSSSDSVGDPRRSFLAPVGGIGVETTREADFCTATFAEYLEIVSGSDTMRDVVTFVMPLVPPSDVKLLYTLVVVVMVGSGLGVPERSKGSLHALPKGVDVRETAPQDISNSRISSVSVTGERVLERWSASRGS